MKVYIYFPPRKLNGGVECIFQACDAINRLGGDCSLIPWERFKWRYLKGQPVPDKFAHYQVKLAKPSDIEHVETTTIILPEIWSHLYVPARRSRQCIWWLSVEYNYGAFDDFANDQITHFYQSAYARAFLQSKGAQHIRPLHDYIAGFDMPQVAKEDIVCYNPAKGREKTAYIMKMCPNIRFVPLQNMTKEQMIHSLARSKVYIDFGSHPGRDRIPREAVLLNNIVLTSMDGSAKFYEDVPIDSKYKIEPLDENIRGTLESLLANYEDEVKNFTSYKQIVMRQKGVFEEEVKSTFLRASVFA